MTLQEACTQIGVEYRDLPADDRLHTTAVTGKRSKNTSGRIKLFSDGAGGIVMNNVEGRVLTFWYGGAHPALTAADKAARATRLAREEQEKAVMHLDCLARCEAQLSAAPDATNANRYLKRKGVNSYGLKALRDHLIVPVTDITGRLQGLQYISPNGSKWFETGSRIAGHFYGIGTAKGGTLLIAEGYATAATVHQATGHPALVAFNAGNLRPVAETVKGRYPQLKIIICADNDQWTPGNPGLTKATEAARAVNGLLAIPVFGEASNGQANRL